MARVKPLNTIATSVAALALPTKRAAVLDATARNKPCPNPAANRARFISANSLNKAVIRLTSEKNHRRCQHHAFAAETVGKRGQNRGGNRRAQSIAAHNHTDVGGRHVQALRHHVHQADRHKFRQPGGERRNSKNINDKRHIKLR
jgi:putative DNA binding protein HU